MRKMTAEQENDLMDSFFRVSMAMEPENLYCDGEVSHAEAMRKLKSLQRTWANLEKQIGRRVTENEVYQWWDKRSV
jgi:hypothetical protein